MHQPDLDIKAMRSALYRGSQKKKDETTTQFLLRRLKEFHRATLSREASHPFSGVARLVPSNGAGAKAFADTLVLGHSSGAGVSGVVGREPWLQDVVTESRWDDVVEGHRGEALVPGLPFFLSLRGIDGARLDKEDCKFVLSKWNNRYDTHQVAEALLALESLERRSIIGPHASSSIQAFLAPEARPEAGAHGRPELEEDFDPMPVACESEMNVFLAEIGNICFTQDQFEAVFLQHDKPRRSYTEHRANTNAMRNDRQCFDEKSRPGDGSERMIRYKRRRMPLSEVKKVTKAAMPRERPLGGGLQEFQSTTSSSVIPARQIQFTSRCSTAHRSIYLPYLRQRTRQGFRKLLQTA